MRLVVKLGGSILKEGAPDALLDDIAVQSGRHQLILVHGGGDIVTEVARKLGKEQRFIVSPEGVRSRFTDKETAEIYTMVMSGMISARLTAGLAKRGVRAVSLSGMDGSLLLAKRKRKLVVVDERGRKVAIDGGYTGRVERVNSGLLLGLLGEGYLPVISPVAISEGGEPLNIDGDRAASSTAVAVEADAVAFLTNVQGVLDGGRLVERLTTSEARAILPSIGFGMQKKVLAAAESVEAGVREAIICSGTGRSPVGGAVRHLGCTVVS